MGQRERFSADDVDDDEAEKWTLYWYHNEYFSIINKVINKKSIDLQKIFVNIH